jgi:hypothetical protein
MNQVNARASRVLEKQHAYGSDLTSNSNRTPSDEDITPMYMAETPPIVTQSPITRARTRQLHQYVSSFLSTCVYSCKDGMLSNDIIDYIVLRNFGDDHEILRDQHGPGGKQGGRPSQDGGPIQLRFNYLGHQELGSLKSSPRLQKDSDFNDPHIPGMLTRYPSRWNLFQLNWTSELTGIRVTTWRTQLSRGAASPIWAIRPSIVSESIRDASRGRWPNPRSYKTLDAT